MALVTANGLDVTSGRIVLPRARRWFADLAVDDPDGFAVGDAVELVVGDGLLTLRGTAGRADVFLATAGVHVLGGADGLSTRAAPKWYRQAPARLVWDDLLRTAGEAAASSADAGLLSTTLPAWCVRGASIGMQLDELVVALGATWRVLVDGTIWVGQESWPEADVDLELMELSPPEDRAMFKCEAPALLPGTVLDGRRVSRVEHLIGEASVRTIAYYEAA